MFVGGLVGKGEGELDKYIYILYLCGVLFGLVNCVILE